MNLNYVPWMTLIGVAGAGIGYLLVGGRVDGQSFTFPLYGLCVGCLVGILVRVVVRHRTTKQRKKND